MEDYNITMNLAYFSHNKCQPCLICNKYTEDNMFVALYDVFCTPCSLFIKYKKWSIQNVSELKRRKKEREREREEIELIFSCTTTFATATIPNIATIMWSENSTIIFSIWRFNVSFQPGNKIDIDRHCKNSSRVRIREEERRDEEKRERKK
jgi:hypothetical protein